MTGYIRKLPSDIVEGDKRWGYYQLAEDESHYYLVEKLTEEEAKESEDE